jgi:hypothetical protein
LIGCDSNPIFSGTTQRLVDVILRPGPIFPDQVTTAYPRGLLGRGSPCRTPELLPNRSPKDLLQDQKLASILLNSESYRQCPQASISRPEMPLSTVDKRYGHGDQGQRGRRMCIGYQPTAAMTGAFSG